MRAIISTKPGPPEVLVFREVPKPVPRDNEILVKVHTATVTIGDVFLRKSPRVVGFLLRVLLGFKPRRIPGTEFAGTVDAAGNDVKLFRVGDEVFGTTTGLKDGGNAEYVCVPEKWKHGVVTRKPPGVSFADAAALPVGGMTALYLLRKAKIQPGQKVLVYGASGSVGTYAVQLARMSGAEVTGICSTGNLELVRSLGAGTMIDYTKEDFRGNGVTYDVIFDAVGKISASRCKSSLQSQGRWLTVRSMTSEKTEDLISLGELLAAGKIRPVIDRYFPLEETVEAHRYVEQRNKKGNVIITVA